VRRREFDVTAIPAGDLEADVAVVGSGFAGALVALALRRRGRSVVLIEQGRHPRFVIGESSTPLSNLLLEELAQRYDLPAIRAFSKWGTWQRTRPDVAVGLKRGFSFFFHRPDEAYEDGADRERQLLVAASPHDEIGDTHWYRPEFDHALVREAESAGAIYLDETRVERVVEEPARMTLEATRHGRSLRVRARFLVDASGPRGFLHRALGTADAPCRWMPPTHGLYTHFADVDCWERMQPALFEGAPFPPDTAALHHVFPGGWIWVLRFNNGITSAGAALTDAVAARIGAADGESAWNRLLSTLPSVAEQFSRSRVLRPFVHTPRLAFRTDRVCGARWALLPSAAGIIDPLLSTGFALTLLGIARLLALLEETAEGAQRQAAMQAYARATQDELDATEQLVAALYANMADPVVFKRLTLLYFAAASYSETARRLGKAALAPAFLLHDHRLFGRELRACTRIGRTAPSGIARQRLLDRIDRAIEPFDTAGLLDRRRHHWYPVLAEDLVAGAAKFDASPADLAALLERSGFRGVRLQADRAESG
jgi:FADH2 O2-dependent halogenase